MAQNDIAAALSAAGPGGTSALVGRPQSWSSYSPAGPWNSYGLPPDQPIRVQSADGAVHEFPAGTAPHLIDAAMKNYAQSQADGGPSVAGDVAKQIGTGLVSGAENIPTAVPRLMGAIGQAATPAIESAVGYFSPAKAAEMHQAEAERQAFMASTPKPFSIADQLPQPQTTAGQYARTAAEFVPAMMAARGSLLKNAVVGAGAGLASEAGGQVAGTPGRVIGGLVGAGGLARGVSGASEAAAAEVPTAAELKAAAQAGYRSPEVAAVAIKPEAVSNLSTQIENDLVQRGFRPTAKSASDTFAEVRGLQAPPGVQSVKVADLDTARQALGNLSKEVDAIGQPTAEAAAAQRAISHIDDFLPNLDQADLLAGDAAKANSILQEARANYRAYKQSSLVDTKQGNAELQAASTYGGGNINNATRQAFRPLLKNNEAGLSGFSPEAADQANQVVTGGPLGNTMRQIGRLAPVGPVNMGLHVGAAFGTGGWTIPASIAAYGAKKLGEGLTRSEVDQLRDIIARQSPLYASRQGQAAVSNALLPPGTPATAATPVLLRSLLLSQQQQQPRSPLYAQGQN